MAMWLLDFLGKAFAVMGAAIGVQMPMFIQQYTHQLAGSVAELQLHIDANLKAASMSGKSLTEYIQKFLNSGDSDFIAQGNLMKGMMDRASMLSDAMASLESASMLSKPFLFLSHFDIQIAKNTWRYFQLGIPLTLEGLLYALGGMLIVGMAFSGCVWVIRGVYRQIKACTTFNGKLARRYNE